MKNFNLLSFTYQTPKILALWHSPIKHFNNFSPLSFISVFLAQIIPMARSYHMIRNIVGETGTWRIKIKAIYQWKTYEQNGEVNGIHTILIDEEV